MFPRRYYAGRMFAPRYFPQSQGASETIVPRGTFRRDPGSWDRTFARDEDSLPPVFDRDPDTFGRVWRTDMNAH